MMEEKVGSEGDGVAGKWMLGNTLQREAMVVNSCPTETRYFITWSFLPLL